MLYVGGLTFAKQSPESQLQIPNLVAAHRLIKAIFDRYRLSTDNITASLQILKSTGNISALLGGYQTMIGMRDNFPKEFDKTKEVHRDSIYSR